MGSVLGTGEVGSVRVFLGTWGRSSPLAVVLLAAWQALALPLPHEAVVRGAAQVFGSLVGGMAAWAGLTLGSLAVFGIARALVGIPLRAVRERRGTRPEPLGIDRRVVLGLRLVPFLPQDVVSIVCGATRMRWRDFAAVTAVGTVPTVAFFTVFADRLPDGALNAYVAVSAVVGLGVLGWTAWRERGRITWRACRTESRRRLAVGAVLAVVAWAAYAFVPGVHLWVDTAVDVLGRGDIVFVRDYLLGFGAWAPVVSGSLMVLQSVLAPLPAFVVTFANGLLFGWAWGALLSWSSAMAGAALCFWIARSLGRPVAEKLAGGGSALEVVGPVLRALRVQGGADRAPAPVRLVRHHQLRRGPDLDGLLALLPGHGSRATAGHARLQLPRPEPHRVGPGAVHGVPLHDRGLRGWLGVPAPLHRAAARAGGRRVRRRRAAQR